MKIYHLHIQDHEEDIWDFVVKNKKEGNMNETLICLVKEEAERIKRLQKKEDLKLQKTLDKSNLHRKEAKA